jgi:hypothetical protein
MKSEIKWMFRMETYRGYGHDFWEAYKLPEPRKWFHYFQNFKVVGHEKDIWTSEELFMKKYQDINPLMIQKLYESSLSNTKPYSIGYIYLLTRGKHFGKT